ncbi:hypothetical protein P3T36_002970 [Kitasatospora sp. MAP12-15]|uniref:hypothetical protein n=1 Tax=unclassified Kitasatospora TaxID=2633591 RepID=UPI00247338A4|nr:hypothetical protein [Kitasatospora sp. MAP12-44]MDH6108839.1 hypothetical protein [Kitasatospora sp. MAP12-44]
MEGEVETEEQRMARELRDWAERTLDQLDDAFKVAELPSLLGVRIITLRREGVHVELGGCNIRTVQALTAFILAHARCMGRVQRGEIVPSGLAELPAVRMELGDE